MSTDAPTPSSTARTKGLLCPYCGTVSADSARCDHCKGLLDPLSRQATQNAMGPWRLRDERAPFSPGFSFHTLRQMISKGRISASSIIAGPTTRQFWMPAGRAPGIANLLGLCHACRARVSPAATRCPSCNASFEVPTDRQHLGLGAVHLVPGQSAPEAIAAAALTDHGPPPPPAANLPSAHAARAPTPPSPPHPDPIIDVLRNRVRVLLALAAAAFAAIILLVAGLGLIVAGPLWGLNLTLEPAEPPAIRDEPQPQEPALPEAAEPTVPPPPDPTAAGPEPAPGPDDPFGAVRPGLLSPSIPDLEAAIAALEAILGQPLAEPARREGEELLREARARLLRLRARELP